MPTVSDNHILTDYVCAVVNAVFVENILNTERNEHRQRLRSEGSEGVNLSCTIRHNRIESVHLLKFKHTELTEVLSARCHKSFGVLVELSLCICRMNKSDNGKHHSLISCSQVIKKLLHFFLLLLHIIRNCCREVIVRVLSALPIRDIGFYTEQTAFRFTDCFIRRHGYNVNRHHQVSVEVGQLRNHTVLDIRSILTKEKDSAVAVANLEMVGGKLHRVRAYIVLKVVSFLSGFLNIETERTFFTDTEEVVNNSQAVIGFHFIALTAESAEVCNKVCTNTGEVISCFFNGLLVYRDSYILVLHNSVSSGCVLKHNAVLFLSVHIEEVARIVHLVISLKVKTVEPAVVDSDFRCCTAIKRVKQFGILKEHCFLVLTACNGIVYIRELKGLCELISTDKENAVIVNSLDRNYILNTLRYNKLFFILFEKIS